MCQFWQQMSCAFLQMHFGSSDLKRSSTKLNGKTGLNSTRHMMTVTIHHMRLEKGYNQIIQNLVGRGFRLCLGMYRSSLETTLLNYHGCAFLEMYLRTLERQVEQSWSLQLACISGSVTWSFRDILADFTATNLPATESSPIGSKKTTQKSENHQKNQQDYPAFLEEC